MLNDNHFHTPKQCTKCNFKNNQCKNQQTQTKRHFELWKRHIQDVTDVQEKANGKENEKKGEWLKHNIIETNFTIDVWDEDIRPRPPRTLPLYRRTNRITPPYLQSLLRQFHLPLHRPVSPLPSKPRCRRIDVIIIKTSNDYRKLAVCTQNIQPPIIKTLTWNPSTLDYRTTSSLPKKSFRLRVKHWCPVCSGSVCEAYRNPFTGKRVRENISQNRNDNKHSNCVENKCNRHNGNDKVKTHIRGSTQSNDECENEIECYCCSKCYRKHWSPDNKELMEQLKRHFEMLGRSRGGKCENGGKEW
ncbi:8243_t:CDS:1 [Paraglomus occultum]|uniref:8243_t:CDS:1 n=1 Tax=Paraglomus occultum TaxID=144539 RepID=A0A9N9FS96_9GLOM|nr:8243_t:CDS:1 [Paraglomus occultum]